MTHKILKNNDHDWLSAYKTANADRLSRDPDFANWLDTEYVPIAGGWQY